MQINRLLETVYLLIEKKKITARELSDYFEVSQRTIYRDVEALSAAGIPVYAEKGKGGGIRLLDNYVIKKSLLSEQEQVNLLASLQGMQALNGPELDPVLRIWPPCLKKKMPTGLRLTFPTGVVVPQSGKNSMI